MQSLQLLAKPISGASTSASRDGTESRGRPDREPGCWDATYPATTRVANTATCRDGCCGRLPNLLLGRCGLETMRDEPDWYIHSPARTLGILCLYSHLLQVFTARSALLPYLYISGVPYLPLTANRRIDSQQRSRNLS